MSNALSQFEEGVFAGALVLPEAERLEFVRRASGGDAALCARLEALLRGHEKIDGALDAATPGDLVGIGRALQLATPVAAETPREMGRYRLMRKIGEGGFGEVWQAEQREPVRRDVAVKIIRPGMDTREVIARFEMERQALALMDHPNIARVLDGGATESGRPYFIMELVPGVPITRYCDEHRLDMRARLQLFLQVCRAVQHAHQKGVIHRDLKPSNILVVEQDGIAVPKVIDFGIAKAVSGRLTDTTVATAVAQCVGTPAYMSPEQVELGRRDIDTRSDIYNLGVLLYELLTGHTPFDTQDLSAKSFDEWRSVIRDQEPLRPSTRLSTLDVNRRDQIALQRSTDFPRLQSALRGDIDWIAMCCLEKDRTRRYDTANGLARDIERHLKHEPVTARPPTAAYVLYKTMRRHRVAFTMGGVITVSLVFAVVASRLQAQRADQARNEAYSHKRAAEIEAERSKQVTDLLRKMLQGVEPQYANGRDTQLLRSLVDDTAAKVRSSTTLQPEVAVEILETLGLVYSAMGQHRTGTDLLKEALARYEAVYGRENTVAAELLHQIGVCIEKEGASYEPEPWLREALRIREKLLPPGHPEVARTRCELGGFLARYEPVEADRILNAALGAQRAILGESHPDVAKTVAHLARAKNRQLQWAEGERLARESIVMYNRHLGPNAADLFEVERTLAASLGGQKKAVDAAQVIRDALERCKRLMSERHPMYADLLLDLSRQLLNQQRAPEAEAAIRESVRIAQEYDLPGPAGQSVQVLRGILLRQGREPEAEELMRRQIELTRPQAAEYPMMMALHEGGLAQLLLDRKDFAQAEPHARAALALRLKADRKGWLTQNSRRQVATALAGQGKFGEAESILLAVHDDLLELNRRFPTYTPGYIAFTIESLIELYHKAGRQTEADRWTERGFAHVDVMRELGHGKGADDFRVVLEKLSLPRKSQ